jgi:hypothetical protein
MNTGLLRITRELLSSPGPLVQVETEGTFSSNVGKAAVIILTWINSRRKSEVIPTTRQTGQVFQLL